MDSNSTTAAGKIPLECLLWGLAVLILPCIGILLCLPEAILFPIYSVLKTSPTVSAGDLAIIAQVYGILTIVFGSVSVLLAIISLILFLVSNHPQGGVDKIPPKCALKKWGLLVDGLDLAVAISLTLAFSFVYFA